MALRPLIGTRSVLLLDGAEHLRRRKLVLPPFHGERMRAYEVLIREATRREIATWPLGEPVPTLPRMQAITLRVILRAVFGLEEGPELDRLGAMLRRLVNWTTDPRRAFVFGFLGPDRLMGLSAFRRQLADLDRELVAEIARRRDVADLGDRTDILSLLLRARDEDGAALSDRELRDQLITLLVAGHETTAATLSWALTDVAAAPEAQARLANGEQGLAEAGITETLRLHPPVPLGGVRRLRHAMTVAGWKLPAGATLAPCSLLVHRAARRLPTADGLERRPLPRAAPSRRRMDPVRRGRAPLRRRRVRPIRSENRARRADPHARAATGGHTRPTYRPPRHRHRPRARRPSDRDAPPPHGAGAAHAPAFPKQERGCIGCGHPARARSSEAAFRRSLPIRADVCVPPAGGSIARCCHPWKGDRLRRRARDGPL